MFRHFLAGVAGLLLATGAALAADREVKGTLVHVDAERHTITISEKGKRAEYNLAERGLAVIVAGKESTHELKDKSLVKGAEVTLHLAETGKTVHEIHVAHHAAGTRPGDGKPGDHSNYEPRGTAATITRVDADKNVIIVKTSAGKTVDLHVGEDTKFIGPQGGHREKGIKDDVVAVGAEIHYVAGKTGKVEEIHLPFRHAQSEDKKPAGKKPTDRKPSDK
jgi:hypothetical protein